MAFPFLLLVNFFIDLEKLSKNDNFWGATPCRIVVLVFFRILQFILHKSSRFTVFLIVL
jgi:hypothetical protein